MPLLLHVVQVVPELCHLFQVQHYTMLAVAVAVVTVALLPEQVGLVWEVQVEVPLVIMRLQQIVAVVVAVAAVVQQTEALEVPE